jgi:phytoene dehydrogenase-like protein
MTTVDSFQPAGATAVASRSVVVIGSGIAGLIAAIRIAERGLPVTLVERSVHVGGRAATRNRDGFLFNLGPHALYRRGRLMRTLKELDIATPGALPPTRGAFALYHDRRYTLPVGFASLLGTRLLSVRGKFDLARILAALPKVDTAAVSQQTLASWLDAHMTNPQARSVVEMLVRVTSFTHDTARQSAGAAIEQLQLALAGNVLYLDGGWQTIVDGLRGAAACAGVRVRLGTSAAHLERDNNQAIAVRLADGTVIPSAAVVIAASPAEVDRIIGVNRFERAVSPVRVATLDVALRRLPDPRTLAAFGVDEPLYFSVHSAAARLAPAGGALMHASMYLEPGHDAHRNVEHRLEALLDDLQPGWRHEVVAKHYLPGLIVTHAELVAGAADARPTPRVGGCSNVFVAGDWVGSCGQLSDAAAASAEDAAALAVAAARTISAPEQCRSRVAVA